MRSTGYPYNSPQRDMDAIHQLASRKDAVPAPLTSIHHSDMTSRLHRQAASHQLHQESERGFPHDAMAEPVRRSGASPTATTRDAHPPVDRSSQPRHSPDTHPAPSTGTSDTATTRLRLKIKWEVTLINVWLDLEQRGEAFFQAFQRELKGRRQIHDRSNTTIRLMTDQSSRTDSAYNLSLGIDELECDWETTLDWLKENKRDQPPHFIGVIEDYQNG